MSVQKVEASGNDGRWVIQFVPGPGTYYIVPGEWYSASLLVSTRNIERARIAAKVRELPTYIVGVSGPSFRAVNLADVEAIIIEEDEE